MRVLTEAGKEKGRGAGDTEILLDKSIGKMMPATARRKRTDVSTSWYRICTPSSTDTPDLTDRDGDDDVLILRCNLLANPAGLALNLIRRSRRAE